MGLKTLFAALLIICGGVAEANLKNSDKGELASVNLLTNPGFELGLGAWSASAGTFAIVTSGANLGTGGGSGSWDASAGSQTLSSSLYTIPNLLLGHSCVARLWYKGGDANLTFQVVDNGGATVTSAAMSAHTTYAAQSLTFTCPSSGSIRLRVSASANAAIVYLDQAFLGYVDTVSTPSNLFWYVAATLIGANLDLGVVDKAAVEITNAGLAIVLEEGSQTAQIACISGTASEGLNCNVAAVAESVGIAFTIPAAGKYEACFVGTSYLEVPATAGNIGNIFKIGETTNTSAALIAGTSDIFVPTAAVATAALTSWVTPFSVCEVLEFGSSGLKTLRLFNQVELVSGSANANTLNCTSINGVVPTCSWTVRPWSLP